jgi:hypothetical protein
MLNGAYLSLLYFSYSVTTLDRVDWQSIQKFLTNTMFDFQKVQPAFMEFTVKANLLIEPDGAFLLEGATAKLQLFEHSGILDKEGNPTKVGEYMKINYYR